MPSPYVLVNDIAASPYMGAGAAVASWQHAVLTTVDALVPNSMFTQAFVTVYSVHCSIPADQQAGGAAVVEGDNRCQCLLHCISETHRMQYSLLVQKPLSHMMTARSMQTSAVFDYSLLPHI
jgi:hypothetical protein